MAISYKLEKFEGPLDLLLHLIDKNKIDISKAEGAYQKIKDELGISVLKMGYSEFLFS